MTYVGKVGKTVLPRTSCFYSRYWVAVRSERTLDLQRWSHSKERDTGASFRIDGMYLKGESVRGEWVCDLFGCGIQRFQKKKRIPEFKNKCYSKNSIRWNEGACTLMLRCLFTRSVASSERTTISAILFVGSSWIRVWTGCGHNGER
jgi:hypothetical protein